MLDRKQQEYLAAYATKMEQIMTEMQVLVQKADQAALEARCKLVSEQMAQDLEFYRKQTQAVDRQNQQLQRQCQQLTREVKSSREAEQFMRQQLVQQKQCTLQLQFERTQNKPSPPQPGEDQDLYVYAQMLVTENESLRARLSAQQHEAAIAKAQLECEKTQLLELTQLKADFIDT